MKLVFRLMVLVFLGAPAAYVAGQNPAPDKPMPSSTPITTITIAGVPVVADPGAIPTSCQGPSCAPACCPSTCIPTQTQCCLEPRERHVPVYNSCREQACRTYHQCGWFLHGCCSSHGGGNCGHQSCNSTCHEQPECRCYNKGYLVKKICHEDHGYNCVPVQVPCAPSCQGQIGAPVYGEQIPGPKTVVPDKK